MCVARAPARVGPGSVTPLCLAEDTCSKKQTTFCFLIVYIPFP